jgi:hypothetical protein
MKDGTVREEAAEEQPVKLFDAAVMHSDTEETDPSETETNSAICPSSVVDRMFLTENGRRQFLDGRPKAKAQSSIRAKGQLRLRYA